MSTKLSNTRGQKLVSDADHLELARLVTEAAWRVDEGKSDTLYELFVDAGELAMGSTVLKGKEAIRDWGRKLEEAHTYRCIRHVAGNMRFAVVDDDTVGGITVLTVFMDDQDSSTVPWVVGEDHDRFVRTQDGWRFASRRWIQLFARPT